MDTKDGKELEASLRLIIEEAIPTAELRVMAEQQKRMLELVEKHNITLYGNGKEGLTTTVSRLDRWVSGVQKTLDNFTNWLLIACVGGAAIYILALAAQHSLIK